jgi:hypothetical protein
MIENASDASLLDVAENLDLMEVLIRFVAIAFIIAGVLAIAFIFFGGISFILSGGNEEKIKQAISTIRYSVIGLIFAVGAIFVVGVLAKFLGVSDTINFLKYSEIIETIQTITQSFGAEGGGAGIERLE